MGWGSGPFGGAPFGSEDLPAAAVVILDGGVTHVAQLAEVTYREGFRMQLDERFVARYERDSLDPLVVNFKNRLGERRDLTGDSALFTMRHEDGTVIFSNQPNTNVPGAGGQFARDLEPSDVAANGEYFITVVMSVSGRQPTHRYRMRIDEVD